MRRNEDMMKAMAISISLIIFLKKDYLSVRYLMDLL